MTTNPAVEIDLERLEADILTIAKIMDSQGMVTIMEKCAFERIVSALARRYQPVEAQASADDILRATAKRICDRWDAEVPGEEVNDEHRDLRSALARASQAVAEPVGEVVMYPNYSTIVHWKSGMPPSGTKLYAAPVAQQSEAQALQTARNALQFLAMNLVPHNPRAIAQGALDAMKLCASQPVKAGAPTADADDPARAALRKLCDQLEGMKHTMFLMPGTGQHYSYWLREDASFYVEEARKFLAAPTSGRESAAPAAPVREGDREQDAKDAGALGMALVVNKKLGDVLLGRSYLLPDDLSALKRFEECASDFDSGGHDVSKPAMARLREIGVVQSVGFGRHQTTSFGDYVLERNAGEPVSLPLMTLAERNAAMQKGASNA